MPETNYDINHLPEGKLLYEESSVRSVSEAIRAITGRNEKYSHLEQAEAILKIKNYIYPFFMLGPGSGGIGCTRWWNNENDLYHMGPIFPNLLYNLKAACKNLNIIFKVSKAESGIQKGTLDARVRVGGYDIYVELQSDNPMVRVDGFGSYDYSSYGEVKISIDTYLEKLYLYIDDVVCVNGIDIDSSEFIAHNEEGREYFDLVFPSYAEDPGTNDGRGWHTCEIKYFRMEAEDWE